MGEVTFHSITMNLQNRKHLWNHIYPNFDTGCQNCPWSLAPVLTVQQQIQDMD